jgi:hypothetical protein
MQLEGQLANLDYLDLRSNPLNMDAYKIYIPQILENNPGMTLHVDPIPEPSNLVLLAMGTVGFLAYGRRNQRRR